MPFNLTCEQRISHSVALLRASESSYRQSAESTEGGKNDLSKLFQEPKTTCTDECCRVTCLCLVERPPIQLDSRCRNVDFTLQRTVMETKLVLSLQQDKILLYGLIKSTIVTINEAKYLQVHVFILVILSLNNFLNAKWKLNDLTKAQVKTPTLTPSTSLPAIFRSSLIWFLQCSHVQSKKYCVFSSLCLSSVKFKKST